MDATCRPFRLRRSHYRIIAMSRSSSIASIIWFALGLSVASTLTGCTSLVIPGDTVSSHSKGHSAEPEIAPSDGDYVLLHKYGDPTPLESVSLNAGDRLGFMTGETGK